VGCASRITLRSRIIKTGSPRAYDPNASLLTEGIAAIAGYKGVEAITEHLEKKEEDPDPAQPA
jgi:hypothetical protein